MRPEDQVGVRWELVWWPNRLELVEEALRLLNVGRGDVVLDVGAGDLRASVMALGLFDADLCIAVDVHWRVMSEALRFLKMRGFDGLGRLMVLCADYWTLHPRVARAANKVVFLAWRVSPRMERRLARELDWVEAIVHNFGDPDRLRLVRPCRGRVKRLGGPRETDV